MRRLLLRILLALRWRVTRGAARRLRRKSRALDRSATRCGIAALRHEDAMRRKA